MPLSSATDAAVTVYGAAGKRGARADGFYMAKTYLNDISSDSSQWLMDINWVRYWERPDWCTSGAPVLLLVHFIIIYRNPVGMPDSLCYSARSQICSENRHWLSVQPCERWIDSVCTTSLSCLRTTIAIRSKIFKSSSPERKKRIWLRSLG